MSERFFQWLEVKAQRYLIWLVERKVAAAKAEGLICPDCETPEPLCYCEDKARAEEVCQGAFEAGIDRGMEQAVDAYQRGDWL